MTKQNLPDSFPLNGSDYFQLVLDRHIAQSSAVGNIGRFVVVVEGGIEESFLSSKLLQSSVFQWVIGLNKPFTFPFQIPKWKNNKGNKKTSIHFWKESSAPGLAFETAFNRSIRLGKDALLFIDVIPEKNKTTLVFSFHHALMDARGVEGLVRYLGENISAEQLQKVLPDSPEKLPIIEQLNEAKKVKEMLLYDNRTSPAILSSRKPRRGEKVVYHQLEFTEEETKKIDENSRKKKVRFGKSPFFLAATARSFHHLLQRIGKDSEAYWIPVPQDQRKKGIFGPIIGNQVSYLFYKLFPKDLTTIEATIAAISEQMMQQIRSRIPMSYKVMMDLFRRLPLPIYSKFMKSPTKGAISSFFFSDTGTSLDGFDDFLGKKVLDACHYPPGAPHPGLTVVFGQYRGRIRVMIGYNSVAVSAEDFEFFLNEVRKNLIGN